MRKSILKIFIAALLSCVMLVSFTAGVHASQPGYVNTDGIAFRVGSNSSSELICYVNAGTYLDLVSELKTGWCKVVINGETGYMFGKYVSLGDYPGAASSSTTSSSTTEATGTEGYINTDGINFRKGPGKSYGIHTSFDLGTSVSILTEEDSGWCKVKYNGTTGYVWGKYLSFGNYSGTSSGTSTSETATAEAGYINRDNVNFRKGPGTGYDVISKYDYGTALSLLSELDTGWCRVRIGTSAGYVYGAYVNKGTPTSTVNTGLNIAGVIGGANGVRQFKSPNTSSEIIASYDAGTTLTIVSEANGWCGVIINGEFGYVYGKYVYYA